MTIEEPGVAAGVRYTSVPGCPQKLFRCEPYAATLSAKACASRFRIAEVAKGQALEPFLHCNTCVVGAAHANRAVTFFSKLYGSNICPRCGAGGVRIVGNRRCVSCYNREREVRIGRNGRGHKPIGLKPIYTIPVRCVVDGKVFDHATMGVDRVEVMAQVLRTHKGRVYFARATGALPILGAIQ